MTSALVVLGGYLLGSMPFGYWVVLLVKGEDIRKVGSGNIGASNVWRTYGRWLGIPIVVLDVAKGFVPALVGALLVGELTAVLAGGAAMLGHWRPLFLRFQKGGKTVATGGGVFLGAAPLLGLIGVAVWIVVFLISRYASLASIVAAALAALPRRSCSASLGRSSSSASIAAVGVLLLHKANIAPPAGGNREPLPAPARVVCLARGASRRARCAAPAAAGLELRAQLPDCSLALGEHVVGVDRLEVDLAREEEVAVGRARGIASSAPLSESRTESSTKRGCRCACSTTNSSSGRFSSS